MNVFLEQYKYYVIAAILFTVCIIFGLLNQEFAETVYSGSTLNLSILGIGQ